MVSRCSAGIPRGTYGFPSGPRTTPLGSCFGASLSMVVAESGAGTAGMPVFCLTLQRKASIMGYGLCVRGMTWLTVGREVKG